MSEARDHGRLVTERLSAPQAVDQRIDAYTEGGPFDQTMAKLIAGHLNGLRPAELTATERTFLDEYGASHVDAALQLLEAIDYGPELYRNRKPLQKRDHGQGRERRIHAVVGKLPRALALRMPTSADTRRKGSIRGRDRWGDVSCSQTLRPAHLGIVGVIGGLWGQRASEDQPYVGCTAGELTQLLTGRTRHGGRDIQTIHQLLSDLEQLELTASVLKGYEEHYRIPSSPIALVERRIGDRWVTASEYAAALETDSTDGGAAGQLQVAVDEATDGPETIRIHLAEWVRAELSHKKRRPVYLELDVWSHLRPQASRIYAFLQGSARDDYDDSIYFYLADPTRFTLGLRGRLDRCAHSVSADLARIVKADRRYERFRRQTHANTVYPAFGVEARKRPSEATELAKLTKCEPKRSRLVRHLDSLRRQAQRPGADGATTLRDFRKISATVSREPKAPARPRRPAVRRQLVYAPPDPAAAAP